MAPGSSFSITVAGIELEVECPLTPAELGITRRLGPFLAKPEQPAVRRRVRWEEAAAEPLPHGALIYNPGAVWRLYRAGRDLEVALEYPTEPRAILQTNDTWSDFTLIEHRNGPHWQSVLRSGATELLVRAGVLAAGGLVLHASGLDVGGRGIVFVGHSGAGKSTQVALWRDQRDTVPLSDDRIAVRIEDGRARSYGTPWGGTLEIARNGSAPLSALVLVEHAPDNELQRLSVADAAPLILARAFLPYWDRGLMGLALGNLQGILERTPVYRLRCRPEPAVVPLVRAIL